MKKSLALALVGALIAIAPYVVMAAAPMPLEDEPFEESMRAIARERNDATRLERARSIARDHRMSSMQVKEIATKLSDDNARLEFAIGCFPRVVDPENFYEVYDAFRSFSKVMRLHDAIAPLKLQPPPPSPVVVTPPVQPLSEKEFDPIYKALKKENFDNARLQTARQILSATGKKFLSSQIKRMADSFDFDNTKLDFAKFAFDYVLDPQRYFVVNDSFDFPNSRQALSQHVESKLQKP